VQFRQGHDFHLEGRMSLNLRYKELTILGELRSCLGVWLLFGGDGVPFDGGFLRNRVVL
jgi:hypothetical protein